METKTNSTAVNDRLLMWSLGQHFLFPKKDGRRSLSSTDVEQALLQCGKLAEDNGNGLRNLISEGSSGLTPPGKSREGKFKLGLSRGKGKPIIPRNGGERSMCHDLWQMALLGNWAIEIGSMSSTCRINSYEVPLIFSKRALTHKHVRISQRKIDLLAATDDGLPVVVEAKKKPTEDNGNPQVSATAGLIAHFLQGLSYAVTLRYTWTHSPGFINEWKKTLVALKLLDGTAIDKLNTNSLTEVPVILAANPDYWTRNYHWGSNQEHWRNLKALVRVANECGYPIFAGRLREPVYPDPKWQFEVTPWDNLPDPSTNNQISFPDHTPNS